jgi:hypothetical protein
VEEEQILEYQSLDLESTLARYVLCSNLDIFAKFHDRNPLTLDEILVSGFYYDEAGDCTDQDFERITVACCRIGLRPASGVR